VSAVAYRMRRDEDGKLRRVAEELGCDGYYVVHRTDCSNCTDHGEYGTKHGPFGCRDCGYTGRRRVRVFVAFDFEAYLEAQIEEEKRLRAP